MRQCHTCTYWEADTYTSLEPRHRSGACFRLKVVLDITLRTGWDGGYVEIIETPGDFGCNRHETKEA